MGVIYAIIQRALTSAGANQLTSFATRLGAKIGSKVTPTIGGIMGSIRNFVGSNKGKLGIVFSVLSSVGINYAMEEAAEALANAPEEDFGGIAVKQEVLARLAGERSRVSGDGSADKVHDRSLEEHGAALAFIDEQIIINEVIEGAVSVLGSVDRVEKLRAALVLEDADYAAYRKMNRLPAFVQ